MRVVLSHGWVCVCKWRAEQVEEEEETPFSPLFTFVASAVASFHLVPFSQHRSLASTLVRYIHESISLSIDLGASFPPFSPTFTSVQYGSWMRSFQDCLVQQLGSYDPDDLFDRLQSVSPPPYPLLASLRFIQGDVPSAHSLLLKGVTSSLSMESVLLPLAHYSIGNEERAPEIRSRIGTLLPHETKPRGPTGVFLLPHALFVQCEGNGMGGGRVSAID